MQCQWPPSYNPKDLISTIEQIRNSEKFYSEFYFPSVDKNLYCQGDIIRLQKPIPVIDDKGECVIVENEYEYWIILNNTCDNSRDIENVPWTQIMPLVNIGSKVDRPKSETNKFRKYGYFRSFYLPSWPGNSYQDEYFADFTIIITIDKSFLLDNIQEVLIARLSFKGWILLNSCLVRYLARTDKRAEEISLL